MKLPQLLTGLGILLTITACTVGNEGLFATIEKEQKVVSAGTINQYITITHMAELQTPSTDVYLVNGGAAMFTRQVSAVGSTWNSVKVGGQVIVTAVGVAGIPSIQQTTQKAYAIQGNQLFTSTDGLNWSPASVALQPGDQPFDLIPIRNSDGMTTNELVLVTQFTIPGTSNPVLYGYGNVYILKKDGTFSGQIQLQQPVAKTNPVTDPTNQVWNLNSACTDGTNYYFLNDTSLWTTPISNTPATGTVTTVSTQVALSLAYAPNIYGGIIYLDQTHGAGQGFYISTQCSGTSTGGIYFVPYSSNAVPTTLGNGPISGSWQSFQGHAGSLGPLLYNSVNNSVWVGTLNGTGNQGGGYAEVVNLGATPQVNYSSTGFQPQTTNNNYNSTVLPSSIVYCLFVDHNGQYYLGTGAEGLWVWNSPNQTWSQE